MSKHFLEPHPPPFPEHQGTQVSFSPIDWLAVWFPIRGTFRLFMWKIRAE